MVLIYMDFSWSVCVYKKKRKKWFDDSVFCEYAATDFIECSMIAKLKLYTL